MRRVAPLGAAAALLAACAGAPDEGPTTAAPEASGGDELVHVQRLAADSDLLWIDFASIARAIDDARAERVLRPALPKIAELSLARTKVTDATVALAAAMPELRRLDLRGTRVTAGGLEALAGHAKLEALVLVETELTRAAIGPLTRLPALKRLDVWHSGLSPQDLKALREQLPGVVIEAGDRLETPVLAEEEPPKLTNDAPLPDGAKAKPRPAAAANTICPVSGKPVVPERVLVDEGKTIGFCCEKCMAAFAAAPEKYRAALR